MLVGLFVPSTRYFIENTHCIHLCACPSFFPSAFLGCNMHAELRTEGSFEHCMHACMHVVAKPMEVTDSGAAVRLSEDVIVDASYVFSVSRLKVSDLEGVGFAAWVRNYAGNPLFRVINKGTGLTCLQVSQSLN
jgi:hypothetical protein